MLLTIGNTINSNLIGSSHSRGTYSCFFGDSITAATNSYARVYHTVKAWGAPDESIHEIIGLGGGGMSSGIGLAHVWDWTTDTDNPPVDGILMPTYVAGRHNYCFNAFGVNDANFGDPAVHYTPAMNSWIDYAHGTAGWPLNKIIIIGPFIHMVNQTKIDSCILYRNANITTATIKGVRFIDVLGFEQSSGIAAALPDTLHPSDAQHLQIAQWLASRT